MKINKVARIVGFFVIVVGVGGLILGENRFGGLNTDIMLDAIRIFLGSVLFASSYRDEEFIRGSFAFFGIAYIANFVIALISPSMFGMLPHEYGMIDNLIHLFGGLMGIGIAVAPDYPIQKIGSRPTYLK